MQGPEIDSGGLDGVSADGLDGLSQLLQIAGTWNDADPEIDRAFLTTRSALAQAWSDHAACDAHAAEAGFAASEEGRAAMAEMDRIQHRIRDLEIGLAARPAGNLAELRLKIALLSLDGQLRPEFEAGVLADALRLLAAQEKG
ncbi:hypothetical protein [Paracoccus shanxieyensis]|uniref:hypothetical protein n=1 Tax=Paracoccus shanxieyensis TaxID=2675752 RepID=UPI0018ACD78B|nr:hypothetical protein [Paracoccus shanxieyensis]